MSRKILLVIALFLLSALSFFELALAHPGRTASDGCHYCRTNCDKWSVPWNQRHCHNGGTQPPPLPPSLPDPEKKIKEKINSVKTDYYTNHWGFREKVIDDMTKQFGSKVALDKIGYLVYMTLLDIKNESGLYKVQRVIDGDTISVSINGKNETLRLIGMDTPETVDPRKPVQCFGREASAKAKEILTGKMVRLEDDRTQSNRDKYQRLLRYVFLEDGTFFNKLMIEEGYAHEYTYQSNPYKYQAEFMEAEKQARENNRGLWSPDSCDGDTIK
jgi:micrococcal nuclease